MRLLPRSRRGTWLLAGALWLAACAGLWYVLPFVPHTIIRLPEAGLVVGFQPDGRTIITAARAVAFEPWEEQGYPTYCGPVRIWDAETGRPLAAFLSAADRFFSARTSRTGRWLALTAPQAPISARAMSGRQMPFHATGPVRLLDLSNGQTYTAPVHPDNYIDDCFFGPSDTWLAGWTADRFRRFPLPDLAPATEVSAWQSTPSIGVAASPDGRALAALDPADARVICVWDVATRQPIGILRRPANLVWWSVAISDGGSVLAGSVPYPDETESEITAWEVATGRELVRASEPRRSAIDGFALSADGRTLVTVTFPNDLPYGWSRLTVRDLPAGSVRFVRDIHTEEGNTASFDVRLLSPDGRTVVVQRNRVTLLELWTAAQRLGLEWLLPQVQRGYELFDARTGRELGFIDTTGYVFHWSPDGDRLMTTDPNDDRLVTIWDIPPRKSLIQFAKWAVLLAAPIGLIAWWRAHKLRAVVPA